MKEHPQAELLRAIADGKQMQEWRASRDTWENITHNVALSLIAATAWVNIRIKPTTILVNGIEVPEPMRVAPENGTDYWHAAVGGEAFGYESTWTNHSVDMIRLRQGLCHTSEANAVAHAKAMLAPSMKGGE